MPHDPKKLRSNLFDLALAAQRLQTQTTTPAAFYAALADLVVLQRQTIQPLAGAQPVVDDLNRLLDSIEKVAETARAENRW